MRGLSWLLALLLVAALALVPAAASQYWVFFVAMILINAIAAQGLNLVMGHAGQVSLGHAAFVAIGAYSTALVSTKLGLPLAVGAALGILLAMLFGVLVGIPSLRLDPLYLAMVTYGLGQVVVRVVNNWIDLTGGPNGVAVKGAAGVQEAMGPYYVVLLCALLMWLAAFRLVRSAYGRSFVAVRENATAARSMGIDVDRVKIVAFVLSAVWGAIAGALYAYLSGFVNPDAFVFAVSINYVAMNVVGGMGTLFGPLLGAAAMTALPQVLGPLAEYQEFIAGLILLVFLLVTRGGLIGSLGWFGRRLGRNQALRGGGPDAAG